MSALKKIMPNFFHLMQNWILELITTDDTKGVKYRWVEAVQDE